MYTVRLDGERENRAIALALGFVKPREFVAAPKPKRVSEQPPSEPTPKVTLPIRDERMYDESLRVTAILKEFAVLRSRTDAIASHAKSAVLSQLYRNGTGWYIALEELRDELEGAAFQLEGFTFQAQELVGSDRVVREFRVLQIARSGSQDNWLVQRLDQPDVEYCPVLGDHLRELAFGRTDRPLSVQRQGVRIVKLSRQVEELFEDKKISKGKAQRLAQLDVELDALLEG